MLVIRMRRMGSKKRPYFRLVVTESRAARDSRFVEVVGYYDPRTRPETVTVNRDRLQHWLAHGAQPSDTVRTLLARHPLSKAPAAGSPAPPGAESGVS